MRTLSHILRRCEKCRTSVSVVSNRVCRQDAGSGYRYRNRDVENFLTFKSLSSRNLHHFRVNRESRMHNTRLNLPAHCLVYPHPHGSMHSQMLVPDGFINNNSSISTDVVSRNKTTSDVNDNRNMRYRYYSTTVSQEGVSSEKAASEMGDQKGQKSRWSNWTGQNSWKGGLLFLGFTFGGMGISLIYSWGEPQRDQDGEIIKDAYTDKPAAVAYTLRAWHAVKDFFQMVRAPTSDKLLPDPLVAPYIQPPYTVVLELSGLLLKPEWDMKMGWRFKKRPGLDYFLQTCAQSGYEVVIFSLEPASVGYPLTISMDPQNIIWYRLFKEDTRYTSGVHIKDLGCLNRDLSKVILLDVTKEAFKLHPRNGITVTKWTGAEDDRELYDLAAFLQTVTSNKVEDIRTVIQHYNQFDDPMAKFRENQAAVLKNHEEMLRLQNEEKKSLTSKSPFISSRRR